MAGNVKVAVVSGAISSSATGTADFTKAGFGTPKACIVLLSFDATNDTSVAVEGKASVGFSDFTNHRCITHQDEDGSAKVDSDARKSPTKAYVLLDTAAVVDIDGTASAITDGVRLTNTTNVSASAVFATVIMFGGTDLQVSLDSITLGNGTDLTTVVTTGIPQDLVFFIGTDISGEDSSSSGINNSFGVVDISNDQATIVNRCMGWTSDHNNNVGAPASIVRNDRCLKVLTEAAGDDWGLELTVATTTSYTVTTRDVSPGAGMEVYALALDLDDRGSKIGSVDSPTSGATWTPSVTLGFTPQYIGLGLTHAAVEGTIESDADAGGLGISSNTGTGEETFHGWYNEDASAAANTNNIFRSRAIDFRNDDTTVVVHDHSHSSFNSGGWTYTINVENETTAKKWFYWAIEVEAVTAAVGDNVVSVVAPAVADVVAGAVTVVTAVAALVIGAPAAADVTANYTTAVATASIPIAAPAPADVTVGAVTISAASATITVGAPAPALSIGGVTVTTAVNVIPLVAPAATPSVAGVAGISRPRIRRKPQPWGPINKTLVERRSARLWDGLVCAVPLWEGAGYPTGFSPKRRYQFVKQAGASVWSIDVRGAFLEGNSTSWYESDVFGELPVGGAARTYITAVRTGTSSNYFWGYGTDSAGQAFQHRLNSGGEARFELVSGFKYGNTDLRNRDFVVIGYSVAANQNVEDGTIYVDGVDDGQGAQTARAINTGTNINLRLLNRASGADSIAVDEDLIALMIWDRVLSADDHLLITNDLFGLITPARKIQVSVEAEVVGDQTVTTGVSVVPIAAPGPGLAVGAVTVTTATAVTAIVAPAPATALGAVTVITAVAPTAIVAPAPAVALTVTVATAVAGIPIVAPAPATTVGAVTVTVASATVSVIAPAASPSVPGGDQTVTTAVAVVPVVAPAASLIFDQSPDVAVAAIPIVAPAPTLAVGGVTVTTAVAPTAIVAPSPAVAFDQFLDTGTSPLAVVAPASAVSIGAVTVTVAVATVTIVAPAASVSAAADQTVVVAVATIPIVAPAPTVSAVGDQTVSTGTASMPVVAVATAAVGVFFKLKAPLTTVENTVTSLDLWGKPRIGS